MSDYILAKAEILKAFEMRKFKAESRLLDVGREVKMSMIDAEAERDAALQKLVHDDVPQVVAWVSKYDDLGDAVRALGLRRSHLDTPPEVV